MGSGKSHWGKIWSDETSMAFYDLDDIIEKEENMSVDELFDKKGEVYFRKKESDLLRRMANHDNCIISCGGGTPCYDDNMKWMNENGLTVYLQASPVKLLENILDEIEKRPVLKNINKGEMLFFVEQKLKERSQYYTKSKIELKVSELKNTTINDIIQNNNS
jgi:shikimate kinase